jgi:hypothetical protein
VASSDAWNLENFLDSLILELDRAQDTLALKGLNRRLTYTVKDMSLDLQLFPEFDGNEVRWRTARPGEQGASKIAFQLGSITDRQIRETTKEPITKDDVAIDTVDGIDPETRRTLTKMGVRSVKDLERMEKKNIDLDKAAPQKIDYGNLANLINRARRQEQAPRVSRAAMLQAQDGPRLSLRGENLATAHSVGGFPAATLDGQPVEVLDARPDEITLRVPPSEGGGPRELRVALDPYAVINLELRS